MCQCKKKVTIVECHFICQYADSSQQVEYKLIEMLSRHHAKNDVCVLSLAGCPLAERSEASPCCCVSYVTADSAEPASTAVVANTDCPVWDHQQECRSSYITVIDSTFCCTLKQSLLNIRLMIILTFTGFQISSWLIHDNLSCSKSGTKEVQEAV